jgi:predicted permease
MAATTTAPTAVNCALLCLQFQNHPDFAARAVFYSTLVSPITVTGIIFLVQGNFLQRFVM